MARGPLPLVNLNAQRGLSSGKIGTAISPQEKCTATQHSCARVPATLSSDERFLSSASLRYMIARFLLLGVVMKCGIGGVLVCLVRFLC